MMRSLIICLISLLSATSALGQIVNVRSGEHSDFTRLVLRVPANTDFDLQQSRNTARLSTSLSDVRYDVSEVFSRIPRTRLQDVTQSRPGAPLELALACTCEVRVIREGADLLVLDILDQLRTDEPVETEAVLPNPELRFALGDPIEKKPQPVPSFTLPVVIRKEFEDTVQFDNASAELAKTANRAGVEMLEDRLLGQISRASEQGLLSVIGSIPAEKSTRKPKAHQQEQTGAQERPVTTSPIEVTTSIDRDLNNIASALKAKTPVSKCIPSERVALHNWSGDQPFDRAVGYLRAELVGEFDKINEASVISLAKTYLHYGFGAEARQTLDVSTRSTPDMAELNALAYAIDDAVIHGRNPFSGLQHCDSDVAMWSALTTPIDGQNINHDAVLQGLARLPDHLRVHLGPLLSRKFANFGDKQTAEAVMRVTNRVLEGSTPTAQLAEASVDLLEGEVATAIERLEQVAESTSEHSPEALVLMIDNVFSARSSVQPDMPELIGSYAVEYRGNALEEELKRAYVISLALSDQFETSFNELAPVKSDDTKRFVEIAAPLLHLLVERADDVTFLRLALHHSQEIEQELPADLTEKIAKRLLDLGFAEQAQRFLFQIDITKASRQRRLLKAEAALRMELPHQAMVALLGMEGNDVDKLRVEAMLQKRDFEMAGQMLRDEETSETAARSLWLSDQTQQVDGNADNRYARVSEVTQELRQEEAVETELSPLASARALIENSSDTRTDISSLLSDFEIGGSVGD